MPAKRITINRAPVLTLWASVVAERLGYKSDESLSLAKAVVGLTAGAKAKRLGIHRPRDASAEPKPKRKAESDEGKRVELLGWSVPVTTTPKGLRATKDGSAIRPESVTAYLDKAFGEVLDDARDAMRKLAAEHKPVELAASAFALYERFRPTVAPGARGWGQKGILDLARIHEMV